MLFFSTIFKQGSGAVPGTRQAFVSSKPGEFRNELLCIYSWGREGTQHFISIGWIRGRVPVWISEPSE